MHGPYSLIHNFALTLFSTMQGSTSKNDLNVNSDYYEAFKRRRKPVKRSHSTPARLIPLHIQRQPSFLASSKPDLSPTVEVELPQSAGESSPSVLPNSTNILETKPAQSPLIQAAETEVESISTY